MNHVQEFSLRYRFFLLIFGLIVPSLAVEGVLRVGGYTPYYLDGRAFVPSRNAAIFYELRPNFRGLYAGVPININSQGFRGRELSSRNDESAFRVVIIGDSIAFGQGVREEETLAEQLGTWLQRKFRSPVEVVNLGVPGYDTCQEYVRFKERALSLKPQIALLLYFENDTDPAVFQVKDDLVVSPDIRTGPFANIMAAARKHSDVYNLVWTRWQVLKKPKFTTNRYRAILASKFDETNPGWRRSRACLADLISFARMQSIRIIVIPFPVLGGLPEKPYPFGGYIETVCNAARAEGAECLDVIPVLQQSDIRLTVSRVEDHPSAVVYMRIAERIEKMLP